MERLKKGRSQLGYIVVNFYQDQYQKRDIINKQKKEDLKYLIIGYTIVILILAFSARIDIFFNATATPMMPIIVDFSQHDESREGTSPNASVWIMMYSDYECQYSGSMYYKIKRIMSEYGDNVNIIFRHYPLITLHSHAFKAAEAAECARDQGKFLEYNDAVYMNQRGVDRETLLGYAQELELDMETFNQCFESGMKIDIVELDMEEAILNGVQGTPTFIINGRTLKGTQEYKTFKDKIDEKLEEIEEGESR